MVTGTKSQTVNVCTKTNTLGQYDYILRIHPPFIQEAHLSRRSFSSLDQFVDYVRQEHGADLEKAPGKTHNVKRALCPALPVLGDPSPWVIAARKATEQCIDQLVLEFVKRPYLHRVEHSIHCRLFQLLSDRPELQADLPFGHWVTQPIHKEWPEHVPRPEKANRRGNFDLVVLSPEAVGAASRKDFRNGNICPDVVIEMGLDYGYDHLAGDVRKLANSGIRYSYLIHLARQDVTDDFEGAERLLINCGFKSAYVRHMGTRVRYKLIGDSSFREHDA